MATSSATVDGGCDLLLNKDLDAVESLEGRHFFIDAGEDVLSEQQKNVYGVRLAEINEFWQSLKTYNNVGSPNQTSPDGKVTGSSPNHVVPTVSIGTARSSNSSAVLSRSSTIHSSSSASHSHGSSPTIQSSCLTVDSLSLPTSSQNVLVVDQNALRMVNSGMRWIVTQNSSNTVIPPIMSTTEVSGMAAPASRSLPPQSPVIRLKPQVVPPIMSTTEVSGMTAPASQSLPPQSPVIRLKPQSGSSSLFNSIPEPTVSTAPGKISKISCQLENLLNTNRALTSSQIHVLGKATAQDMPTAQSPFSVMLNVPPGASTSHSTMKPQSGLPNGQRINETSLPLSLNDSNLALLSTVNSNTARQSPLTALHSNVTTISSPSPQLPPHTSDLPMLPLTRDEVAKPQKTFRAARKSTTPKAHKTPDVSSRSPGALVDLTDDDNLPTKPYNEVQQDIVRNDQKKGPTREKTFPSLVVTVRASLKNFPQVVINNERLLLDNQMRKVMQMAPSMFTEYLLQKRMLRSGQTCHIHGKNLKLGMYSDPGKFPHSGGYVWIAECCSSGLCSVFAGSIFDKTLQAPTVVVKLMYHWACNTAVHNVLNWVKVDNFVIKTYYTFFRAVCTASVHEKLPLLGGPHQRVQVGIISVGTTAQAGDNKEAKVDILAVMDTRTQTVRLRALDNFFTWPLNKVYESKFKRILEVLQYWVHPESIIITDFAVDMALCNQYGFANVVVSGGRASNNNNAAVVDYLRTKIPAMFQNTLSLLSFQIIQQFLDELVWREVWGQIPSRAYESLVNHIAEMTKLTGPDLIVKLKKIASNPFKNWKHAVWSEGEVQNPPKVCLVPEDKNKELAEETRKEVVNEVRTEEVNETRKEIAKEKRKEVVDEIRKEADKERRVEVRKESDMIVEKIGPPEPAIAIPQPKARSPSPTKPQYIPLEPYYYGYIPGNPRLQKRNGTFLAECTLCKRDFLSATSFTNHLIHHALNSLEDLSILQPDQLLTICRRCFNPVRNLGAHMINKHPEPQPGTAKYCAICKLNQGSNEKLFKHMAYMHCELEVPYECELCHFRTSIYDDAAVHFKDFHDKDTCLQCPFCLKVIRFCSRNGLEIARNQVYFVQHIQKHSNCKLNRKCEKCVLSFVNMGTLKDHQERYHCSATKLSEIVRQHPRNPTMMPVPVNTPYPPVTLHESSFHTLNGKALSSSIKVNPCISEYRCAECDSSINQSHFSIKMSCKKCVFHSNCANAMREHSARAHPTYEPTKKSQMLGGNPLLEKVLYCSMCSFHSNNGNRMATHLTRCKNAQEGKPVATPDKRKFQGFCQSRKIKKLRQSYIPGSLEDPPDF